MLRLFRTPVARGIVLGCLHVIPYLAIWYGGNAVCSGLGWLAMGLAMWWELNRGG